MHSISFIFRPGTYDDEFHRLDAATQAVAEATPGYVRSETWWSEDRSVCCAVYYWDDLRHLSEFAQAVSHREAKANYARWYDGYQVVVAEVRAAYGDGRLPHLTSPIAKVRPPRTGDGFADR
jgi:heme-degrading monooxygenase HmoA